MSLVESWAVKGILANLVPSPPLLLKHCILVAFCLPVRVHARFPQPILGDPALVPGLLKATVAILAPACTGMFGYPLPHYYWLLVGRQGRGGKNTDNSFRVPGATGCTSLAPDWEVAGIFCRRQLFKQGHSACPPSSQQFWG